MQPELQMILKQGNCREGSQSHQANYRTAFLHLKLVLDCTIGAMWYTCVDRMSQLDGADSLGCFSLQ